MTLSPRPFHLAFPVHDLDAARDFYANTLGCDIGRKSDRWIDFNFFGHQITAHLSDEADEIRTNDVDGDHVPVRHFGLILDWGDWHSLKTTLEERRVGFMIGPKTRFVGQPGEQVTLFICDPSGNALEFKSFRRDDQIFADG